MKISIKVVPNSRESKIEKTETGYKALLKSAAKENKANIELLKLLSKFFKVPKNQIIIKLGKTSRNKIVEIS